MTEKTRLEELWEEHGWRCVPHGERDCDVCGIDECEACPKWEKIGAILCLERGNAMRERDEARCIARWFDGWFSQADKSHVQQHVEAYLDRDQLEWLNWPDEKSYLRSTPVYEDGALVWDKDRLCRWQDGALRPVKDTDA